MFPCPFEALLRRYIIVVASKKGSYERQGMLIWNVQEGSWNQMNRMGDQNLEADSHDLPESSSSSINAFHMTRL